MPTLLRSTHPTQAHLGSAFCPTRTRTTQVRPAPPSAAARVRCRCDGALTNPRAPWRGTPPRVGQRRTGRLGRLRAGQSNGMRRLAARRGPTRGVHVGSVMHGVLAAALGRRCLALGEIDLFCVTLSMSCPCVCFDPQDAERLSCVANTRVRDAYTSTCRERNPLKPSSNAHNGPSLLRNAVFFRGVK